MRTFLIAGTVMLAFTLGRQALMDKCLDRQVTKAKTRAATQPVVKPETPEPCEPPVENNNTEDSNEILGSLIPDPDAYTVPGYMSSATVVGGDSDRKSARRAGPQTCSTDSPNMEQNRKKKGRKARNRKNISPRRFIPPTVEPKLVSVEMVTIEPG